MGVAVLYMKCYQMHALFILIRLYSLFRQPTKILNRLTGPFCKTTPISMHDVSGDFFKSWLTLFHLELILDTKQCCLHEKKLVGQKRRPIKNSFAIVSTTQL